MYDDWPETAIIPILQDNTFVSFKGIKVGDIDDSQKYSGFDGNIKVRTNEVTSLLVSDDYLRQGEIQTIVLSLKDWKQLTGAQASISVDPSIAELLNVSVDKFSSISSEQLGLDNLSNGKFKFSWIPEVANSNWKIILSLRVFKNSDAIDAISISQEDLKPEAYSSKFNILDLELRSENISKTKSKELKLYQNIPNPFSLTTRIPFEINYDSEISLEIFDVNSKLICRRNGYYKKGYHEIEINKSNLGNQGLYYYQIHTATEHINKRMLMID